MTTSMQRIDLLIPGEFELRPGDLVFLWRAKPCVSHPTGPFVLSLDLIDYDLYDDGALRDLDSKHVVRARRVDDGCPLVVLSTLIVDVGRLCGLGPGSRVAVCLGSSMGRPVVGLVYLTNGWITEAWRPIP